MLQKFYEKEDLLTQTLDQVLTFARTLEGARDSVMVTRENRDAVFHYVSGLKQVLRKAKQTRKGKSNKAPR